MTNMRMSGHTRQPHCGRKGKEKEENSFFQEMINLISIDEHCQMESDRE